MPPAFGGRGEAQSPESKRSSGAATHRTYRRTEESPRSRIEAHPKARELKRFWPSFGEPKKDTCPCRVWWKKSDQERRVPRRERGREKGRGRHLASRLRRPLPRTDRNPRPDGFARGTKVWNILRE